MNTTTQSFLLAAILTACLPLQAAEIQLRSECRSENPLATLGDLASIYTNDTDERQRLSAIDIVPTPSAGSRRYVEIREIQDILRSRGVNLLDHQFSGAGRVLVQAGQSASSTPDQRPISTSAMQSSTRSVREAIENLLTRQDPSGGAWIIDITLDDPQSRLVTAGRRTVSVQGGRAPWVGIQSFEVTAGPADATQRFFLQANVSRPPEVVVAVRSLPRGVRIAPADVRLQPMPEVGQVAVPFSSLDQVIGQETTRSVTANRVMEPNMVRAPLLVRRRDPIKVISQGGGVCVTVTAVAQEEGGLGDMITVETLDRKQTYQAQVSGPLQARVFPVASQVRPTTSQLGSRSNDIRQLQYQR